MIRVKHKYPLTTVNKKITQEQTLTLNDAVSGPNHHQGFTARTGTDFRIISCVSLRITSISGPQRTRIRVFCYRFGLHERIQMLQLKHTLTHKFTFTPNHTLIHTHTCITHTNTHVHTYTSTYMYIIHTYTSPHTCIHIYTHPPYTLIYIHTCTHKHTHTCITRTQTQTHALKQTQTYSHTYMHTLISNTYSYTQHTHSSSQHTIIHAHTPPKH